MERTKLEAIVSRHRTALARLEQQVATARAKLAEAERELAAHLRHAADVDKKKQSQIEAPSERNAGPCKAAGRALRDCTRGRERNSEADEACGKAAKALARCATKSKQRRR
eukprot:413392-Prymnesium_polylepis.3